MKTILHTAKSLILAAGLVGIPSIYAQVEYTNNFESTDDFPPTQAGWFIRASTDPPATFTQVADPADATNNVAQYTGPRFLGTSNRFGTTTPVDATQLHTLAFKYRTDWEGDSFSDVFQWKNAKPVAADEQIVFKVQVFGTAEDNDQGKLRFTYPGGQINLPPNTILKDTWYDMKFIADPTQNKIFLSINGNITESPLITDVDLSTMQIFEFQTGGNNFYMDDLTIAREPVATLSTTDFEKNISGVYPIPAKNQLNIDVINAKKYTVSVYNLAGQFILKNNFSGNAEIVTSSLVSGIYFAKIDSEEGETTIKFTKQ